MSTEVTGAGDCGAAAQGCTQVGLSRAPGQGDSASLRLLLLEVGVTFGNLPTQRGVLPNPHRDTSLGRTAQAERV